MNNLSNYYVILLFLILGNSINAQTISGYVLDEANNPVPFANVLIPERDMGTNSDGEGRYSMNITPGNFDILISCVGYESKRLTVEVKEDEFKFNIYLKLSETELEEAIVKAKGRDPAYAIIQKAIANRKKYLRSLDSYSAEVYIKASEEKIIKEKPERKKRKEEENEDEDQFNSDLELDILTEDKRPKNEISFLEIEMDYGFQRPNKSKQIRTAYQAYGDKEGFLIPQLHEVDFNFYENLVSLKGISDVPLISPVANTAILSYKYKLIHTFFKDGRKVYEIDFQSRKKGNATGEGTLLIADETFNILSIEMVLPKNALKFYDDMTLTQNYELEDDSTWVVNEQIFNYVSKANKYKVFEGKTIISYENYDLGKVFPPKYFSNEVGITIEEAYERDSSYWKKLRPAPLNKAEMELKFTSDSLKTYHNSTEYLDSVQAARNKISIEEVLITGVDFWNYKKKQQIDIYPISSFLDYTLIDGIRLGPGGSYRRRFENQRFFSIWSYANASLRTGKVNGSINFRFLSNPKKLAWTTFNYNSRYTSINPFDAFLSQLQLSNYIRSNSMSLYHRRELVNGLYLWSRFTWRQRRPLGDLAQPDEFIEELVTEEGVYEFIGHEAVITEIALDFTPFQKYMTEPNRKVILGSKFPTFFIDYKRGWNGIFSSDIDYQHLEFGANQKVTLGTLGYSKFNVTAGTFLSTDSLFPEMDLKRIRQSDPILFSAPLNSYQLLDTSLITSKWYIEGHYLHHFNGALINNLPLIKKLKLRTVAGVSAMWLAESNYRHEELLAGVERVFKLGPRRRLKLGVYGIVANSNKTPTTAGLKLAIDVIDTWQKDWSF